MDMLGDETESDPKTVDADKNSGPSVGANSDRVGISGEAFFRSHPSLYPFLYEIISDPNLALPPSLYPALTLLARLIPSQWSVDSRALFPSSCTTDRVL
jgi:hypothetical protein